MIHANDLTLQYGTQHGETVALDDVSFTVDDGDVLGVVGPVESGKTSLAMSLAGFAPDVTGGWSDGELEVAGHDPREDDDGTRIGMVFEDYNAQLTQIRVIDEVLVPLLNRGFDRDAAYTRAGDLLEKVRLDGYGEKRTWELSGGEQQRVAIAAVLAADPDALVFDTATDMLDPRGREHVSNLIASLAGEMTLVVTVDDPQELVGLADDVLVLDDGEVASFGPAEEVLRDHALFESVGVTPPVCLRAAEALDVDADPLTSDEFADALGSATHKPVAADGAAKQPRADGAFGDPVIEAEGLVYEYSSEERAIDEVDLTVHGGEVHAIVGGNGAGKTTLSKLLVGLHQPDAGAVHVADERTDGRSAAAVGEDIALAFQDPDEQLSKRTVEQEVRFPLEERQYDTSGWLPFSKEKRFDDEYIDQRVEEVLDVTGVDEELRDADPTKLPQGDRRLVALAAALAPDPDAVVLDEPTAGLDADGYEHVRETVDRLTAAGKGVVLVEHDMDFVCEVADRVTLLDDGAVARRGTPDDVFAKTHWDDLRERYLRPPRAARLADRVGLDALTFDELVTEARHTFGAPQEVDV